LTIYRDFMQGFFYQILNRGQYKPRTSGPKIFARLRSNVIISVLSSNDLWLGWRKWLWPGRKVEELGNNFPQAC